MGAAFFYHLSRQPLEQTLPVLVAKSLQAGWTVAIRGTDPARMAWLDDRLWLGADDGFLPHGLEGGPHDADQPVLLSTGTGATPDRQCLMAIDGAPVAAAEVAAMEKVCILFDGHDQAALARARIQWQELKAAGCAAQYWSEQSGRWEKKAET
jgi:DNA polymerase-3 subunit chi